MQSLKDLLLAREVAPSIIPARGIGGTVPLEPAEAETLACALTAAAGESKVNFFIDYIAMIHRPSHC